MKKLLSFILTLSVVPVFTLPMDEKSTQETADTEIFVRNTLQKIEFPDYQTISIKIVNEPANQALAYVCEKTIYINLVFFRSLAAKTQEFIIAHEAGHIYYNHTKKRSMSHMIMTGFSAAICQIAWESKCPALFLAVPLLLGLDLFYLRPHMELEADEFAISRIGTAQAALKFFSPTMSKEEFDIIVENIFKHDPQAKPADYNANIAYEKFKKEYAKYQKPTGLLSCIRALPRYVRHTFITGHYPDWYERERIIKYAKKHNIPLHHESV